MPEICQCNTSVTEDGGEQAPYNHEWAQVHSAV